MTEMNSLTCTCAAKRAPHLPNCLADSMDKATFNIVGAAVTAHSCLGLPAHSCRAVTGVAVPGEALLWPHSLHCRAKVSQGKSMMSWIVL